MRLQVISFLRAFLHRIGLQDLLVVRQANVTSAPIRLSLIMSPLKHMLMLCRLLNLTKALARGDISHLPSSCMSFLRPEPCCPDFKGHPNY